MTACLVLVTGLAAQPAVLFGDETPVPKPRPANTPTPDEAESTGAVQVETTFTLVPSSRRKKSTLLAAPRVTTKAGQMASLFVGREIVGEKDPKDNPVASIPLGLRLDITPTVVKGGIRILGKSSIREIQDDKRSEDDALRTILKIPESEEVLAKNPKERTWSLSVHAVEMYFNQVCEPGKPVKLKQRFPFQPKTYLQVEIKATAL